MILRDALLSIQYDSSWGVWAEPSEDGFLTAESPARHGQRMFENGGIDDSMIFICSGEQIKDWLASWHGRDPNSKEFELDPYWIEAYLDEVNESMFGWGPPSFVRIAEKK